MNCEYIRAKQKLSELKRDFSETYDKMSLMKVEADCNIIDLSKDP